MVTMDFRKRQTIAASPAEPGDLPHGLVRHPADAGFKESASGGRWDRPQLHRMLDQLRDGDTLVVWKLDRLSRSLKDVLHIMEKIGLGKGSPGPIGAPAAARVNT